MLKGKDEFFTKKQVFLITVKYVKRTGDKIEFYGGFQKKVKAYRASDAFTIIRRYVRKHNDNRQSDEPEWMETCLELAPESK